MPSQLIIQGAGVPGAADSYYSQEETLSATGSAYTLVPQIGFIMVVAVANLSYVLQTVDASPPTYVTVLAANTAGMVWSDGTNLFVNNSSTTANARYFVLAHKP